MIELYRYKFECGENMETGQLNSIIFDSLHDGVLIADINNTVVYINKSYTRITKVEQEDILGKDLSSVRIGTRLPEVIKEGKKLLGVKREVDGIEYVVNMVPIYQGNDVVGGISILNEINDIYKLTEKLRDSQKVIKKLENKINNKQQTKYTFDDIIRKDKKSEDLITLAKRISKKKVNILITGESGTGKELLAQAIHNESERKYEPFIAINCASLEVNFLETDLFGYVDGAFTGAKKGGKIGLFQKAEGGTIFLDEISEMDYNLQARLLRVLQENIIVPKGGTTEIPIDVRVIAATNKNLETMIANKEFRGDLYYRLAVFTIETLPLRERVLDIESMVLEFLEKSKQKFGKHVEITSEVIEVLHSYSWPGNVRELRNTIEFAVMMTDEELIRVNHLPKKIKSEFVDKTAIGSKTLKQSVKEFEESIINDTISLFGDTLEGKKKAAEVLGISLASLYNKISK